MGSNSLTAKGYKQVTHQKQTPITDLERENSEISPIVNSSRNLYYANPSYRTLIHQFPPRAYHARYNSPKNIIFPAS